MIRLVEVGSQVNEGEEQFAFFDTVRDRFLEINGEQLFDDPQDLEEAMAMSGTPEDTRKRLRGFLAALQLRSTGKGKRTVVLKDE